MRHQKTAYELLAYTGNNPLYYENETFALEKIMFTSITNTMCLFIKLSDSMCIYTCYVYNLYQLTTINNIIIKLPTQMVSK